MDKSQFGRRDRLVQQKEHDTYKLRGKLSEPTVCTTCEAIFVDGRWSWLDPPKKEFATVVCPACQRIADNYPAGHLTIKGAFFAKHREEILNLIRNMEKQEKGERPMERIMAIVDEKDHTMLTTTGIHLARRIGEALSKAYQGDFDFTYGDGEKTIRATWSR